MNILSIFILLTSITIGSPRSPNRANGEDALKALAKATYIKSGINKRIKKLEKKYISEDVRKYTGWATLVIKITNEKKISYEWRF